MCEVWDGVMACQLVCVYGVGVMGYGCVCACVYGMGRWAVNIYVCYVSVVWGDGMDVCIFVGLWVMLCDCVCVFGMR